MPDIEAAIRRVPIFGEAGMKRVYHGAIAYTPDGNPILGPALVLKISGSMKGTAWVLPQLEVLVGSWPNGLSRENQQSICWVLIRAVTVITQLRGI